MKAVNGVTFALRRGTILALVGESGCGKTVTALSVLRLLPYPGRIIDGEVFFDGRDMTLLSKEEMRQIRGQEISMIFQDPLSGLNPVLPVGSQVEEIITSHLPVSRKEARRHALQVMAEARLTNAAEIFNRYPFQLSGGMGQRVMIAIAMALRPKVLIADEPTSALDVTIQAQILEEIRVLKETLGSAVILITHDMGVVAQIADEVAVMYAGSIVEQADTVTLFRRPAHPYTAALLQSLPRVDAVDRRLRPIRGAPPSLVDLPDECPFLPRCDRGTNQCRTSPMPPLEPAESGHLAACYHRIRYDWAQD